MSRVQDIFGVLRGAQLVMNAAARQSEVIIKHTWVNFSLKEIFDGNVGAIRDCANKISKDPTKELARLESLVKESIERPCVVLAGIRQLIEVKRKQIEIQQSKESSNGENVTTSTSNGDTSGIDISSITVKELEEIIAKKNKRKHFRLRTENPETTTSPKREFKEKVVGDERAKNDKNTEEAFKKPDETRKTYDAVNTHITSEVVSEETYVENVLRLIAGTSTDKETSTKEEQLEQPKVEIPELSSVAKQRKVPASRVGRLMSFGTLFASLGIGTVNELTKGALGLGGSRNVKEAFLSPSNAERIVDTLCRVRGAALKIGQILSIQDSNVVSPELVKAFERVRQAADYMPDWQVNRVMTSELGPDWRKKMKHFEDKPFAAASIGQVHRGVLEDGMEVAIKIQYPGVAKSIGSDIDNLVGMLKIWDVFPKGFFIDNLVKVAKRELSWEVDYTREAEYTEKFGEMIAQYKEYHVPKVVKRLTTRSVLTTELVPGVPLDKCFGLSYEHRHFIGESVLKLCLRELFELECMQTDPNWSNFLYDSQTKRIMLIDFGATRFYSREFIKNYKEVIIAAANNDPQAVLDITRQMGFLTGYESKQMEEAHVNAVMILGEIFRHDGEYDFGKQSLTKKISQLVPTMVAHRLCPPPEEIYSIHRKLSGIFLLCSRLNIKMNCRNFYRDIILRETSV